MKDEYTPLQEQRQVIWSKLWTDTPKLVTGEKKKNWLAFRETLRGEVFDAVVTEITTMSDDSPLMREWAFSSQKRRRKSWSDPNRTLSLS